MTTYFQLRSRYRQIYALFALIALVVFAFWAIELWQVLRSYTEREEDILRNHQELLLERKSEQLRGVFYEIYQSTRTVSLLPMIRAVRGSNRHDAEQDVVAQGRMSLDTHRTMQQIYTNLSNSVQVSEMYYVLDGFEPTRDVPFFMYDELISDGGGEQGAAHDEESDVPPEVEDEEYRHFPLMLEWFRLHAPKFIWTRSLDDIPTRISPALRTCDNTQFVSLRQANERDAFGIVYAVPVYADDTGRFKGMITTVIRTNVIEALLVGVPFLPVTSADEARRVGAGWVMPPPSAFRLRQADFGIDIHDRRNLAFADSGQQGRRASLDLDLKTGVTWELEHYLTRTEGDVLIAPIAAERNRSVTGRVILLLVLAIGGLWNFVVLNRTRRELMTMAHLDPLTGLPNRRFFLDKLDQGLGLALRRQRRLALCLLDVANFNAINDAHGTHMGDQLLVRLGERLQQTLGSSSRGATRHESGKISIARLGGDQFTLICPDVGEPADVTEVLDRLQSALRQPFVLDTGSIDISVSIGVALFPDDAGDADKLLLCVDDAMHESRRESAPYCLFNEHLRQHSENESRLLLELKRALEHGQFELFYQPKAHLQTGNIVSLEALLRWRHPQFGLVSPVDFIPLLERSGDIIAVGRWVLEQACRDLGRLADDGFAKIMVSVNVSVRQLRRGDFHHTVAEVLAASGIKPQRIVLEVTESMMMENPEEGGQILRQIDHLGVKLAIDDFGTGYSSITYLQHLPLSYLKLDKAFIDDLDMPQARHIVESVIHLARGLSLQTIAEGIETESQRALLTDMGCDIMQGYLLSKPCPLADIIVWLREYHLAQPTSH